MFTTLWKEPTLSCTGNETRCTAGPKSTCPGQLPEPLPERIPTTLRRLYKDVIDSREELLCICRGVAIHEAIQHVL